VVPIPAQFQNRQGSMVHGDFYWVDVLLNDGTVHKGPTTNGAEIRGIWDGKGSGSKTSAALGRIAGGRSANSFSLSSSRHEHRSTSSARPSEP
jgi:hypothetical protein